MRRSATLRRSSNLHQIGFLHLLAEFYTRTIIPPAVVDELERGRTIGVDLPDVRALPWLTIQVPEGLDKVPTAADLGAGERKCWRQEPRFQAPW